VYFKYVLSYVSLIVIGLSIIILADLLSGMPMSDALGVLRHAFSIVTPVEYILIPMAALAPFLIMARGKK
jgi:hypothetical protein